MSKRYKDLLVPQFFFLTCFISNVAPKDTRNENYKGRRGETTCAETEDTVTTARSASSWRVCRPPHTPTCPAELLYSYYGGLGSTSGDLANGLQGLPAEPRTQRLLVPAEPACPSSRMQNLLEHLHPSLLPRCGFLHPGLHSFISLFPNSF